MGKKQKKYSHPPVDHIPKTTLKTLIPKNRCPEKIAVLETLISPAVATMPIKIFTGQGGLLRGYFACVLKERALRGRWLVFPVGGGRVAVWSLTPCGGWWRENQINVHRIL